MELNKSEECFFKLFSVSLWWILLCGEIFIILIFLYESGAYSDALAICISEILSGEGFWEFLGGVKTVSYEYLLLKRFQCVVSEGFGFIID